MVDRFERFSFAIAQVSRGWHRLAAEELKCYGLKGPHAVYLTTLYAHPDGVTAAQLGELCGKDKADVSRMVTELADKGFVQKELEGNKTYRARIRLTEAGIAAARHVRERAIVAVEHAGRGFSEEHREIFYEVLDTIVGNLHVLSRDGLPQE